MPMGPSFGLSAGLVGLGLTLSGVVGFVTTVPWGRAADRWGARRILVLLLCARAVAFLLVGADGRPRATSVTVAWHTQRLMLGAGEEGRCERD